MVFASTFLSHSSKDKELAHAVARELGQRGILAWLDVNELHVGASLSEALAEAVQKQATLTVFLSNEAVKSGWVERELKVAFEMEGKLGVRGRILPIFLDDREIVVRAHPLLRKRWMDEAERHVNVVGINPQSDDPRRIADELAMSIYHSLGFPKKDEVILYLDQRGEGMRRGEPQLPPDLPDRAPVLVFRPDLGKRTWTETLTGVAWDEFCINIKNTLSEALGTQRNQKRKVYLAGNGQLGLAYLIGKHFARNTETDLYCYGRGNQVFSNTDQPRESAMLGGNPYSATSHQKIPDLPNRDDLGAISLLLCKIPETNGQRDERFIDDPLRYIKAIATAPPPVLVKHADLFNSSGQVMLYIANVVALLQRLRSENGVRSVQLYTSLPFHAIPLLASSLHPYVVDSIKFMEYRSDLREQGPAAEDTYVPLTF